ncbi:MAG: 2-C-methyl-D-erythritol 4-phosphate cytidylyltransferase [Ruminococcus sp.]|nr:2-C-methyl-D-erythritol 4-phosphate cytidylyltransferase [Ruminococcus sp.]
MVFAGIVAGGSGTRMGSEIPKQFLSVGGEAILVRTVRVFAQMKEINAVFVGINPGWRDYAAELFDKAGLSGRAELVDGGSDRNSTVLNIVNAAVSRFGRNKGDIIVTHDAVRPFVTPEVIRVNIACAGEHPACGTYIPSEDTIVTTDDGREVSGTLDRSRLLRAQTPQTFDVDRLLSCVERIGEERAGELTDTCGIFTECGIPIRIVTGDPLNFKITTPYDLRLAELIAGAPRR